MTLSGSRVLYISYNGMLEPLGQSQVMPYLRELSKLGVEFTLLSFERPVAFTPDGRKKCEELKRSLGEDGIDWHRLRYHKSPSLPATAFDVAHGIRYAKCLVRRKRIEIVHARSHIPATIALRLKKSLKIKMIFDVRGLLADEYVDAEHWRKNSLPYRLMKSVERSALSLADGIVTLTEKIWPFLAESDGLRNRTVAHEVVPCCADLDRFRFRDKDREQRRAELGLADRRVLIYSGSIGGWYLTEKIADLFVSAIKQNPDWHLLWLTMGSAQLIEELMSARGITTDQYTVMAIASSEMPSYLAAGDAGVAFYKPGFSRLATSPVKLTEYISCGLPVMVNAGVGDSDDLVRREGIGAVVNEFNSDEYDVALATIESLIGNEDARRRTRAVAERLFDVRGIGVERYARLYEAVLQRASDGL